MFKKYITMPIDIILLSLRDHSSKTALHEYKLNVRVFMLIKIYSCNLKAQSCSSNQKLCY